MRFFSKVNFVLTNKNFQASHLVEDGWKGVKEAVNPGNFCPQSNRVWLSSFDNN